MTNVFVLLLMSLMKAHCAGVVAIDRQVNSLRLTVILGETTRSEFLRKTSVILGPRSVLAGRLVAYASREDMHRAEGTGGTESNYDHFLHNLKVRELLDNGPCVQNWEALKVGKEIMVRSIESECNITQHSSRSHQLKYRQGTLEYQVFALAPEIYDGERDSKGIARLQLFVRTNGPVDIANAKAIIGHLYARTHASELFLVLRGDNLFLDHPSVPVMLLVTQISGKLLLLKEEYRRRPEVYCSMSFREKPHCRMRH